MSRSNTQKEFKKQMKEIEKEQKSGWIREKVYNNATESYEYHYFDKNKRLIKIERRKKFFLKRIGRGLSIGTLVFILWNSFAIFTWVKRFWDYFK